MRNSGIVSLVPLLSLLLLKFFIFWYLQDSFSDVLELTTLKSSMKNLHESIFLYRQGIPLFHLPDSMVLENLSDFPIYEILLICRMFY